MLPIRTLLALCFAGLASAASAQTPSPSPLPQPNLDIWAAGSILAMAPTPDGGMIVGGRFTQVQGLPRAGLAKLQANGAVDPNWNPALVASDTPAIDALAVDANGASYVGGFYSSIGGQLRAGLAKINADGSVDPTWNPAPSSLGARSLVVVGDQLFVAGSFTSIGGQTRSGLAKLSTSGVGAADTQWSPMLSSAPTHMASDGTFLYVDAGDTFTYELRRIAVSGTGSIDTNWVPTFNGYISAFALDAAGSLLIGGTFTSVQGSPRAGLAKLSTASGAALDANFNPGVDGRIQALMLSDGALYAGGNFRQIGGQPRVGLARLSPISGAPDPSFAVAVTGGLITSIAASTTGNIHIGGDFTQVGAAARSALASFVGASAVLQAASDAETRGYISAIAALPGGAVAIGGRFSRIGSQTRQNLARLEATGALDATWHTDAVGLPVPYVQAPGEPGAFEYGNWVSEILTDASGRWYVAGSFDQVGGLARRNLVRLQNDGQVDLNWIADTDGIVQALAADAGGNLYIGGNFAHVSAQARGNLAKLATAPGAALDPLWTASLGLGSDARALALDGAGALFVAGALETVNGDLCCSGLAKLSASGSGARDVNWDVRVTGSGRSVDALLIDGNQLYFGGGFDGVVQGGTGFDRRGLARAATTGTGNIDQTWAPVIAQFVRIFSLALSSDGRLFAAESAYPPQISHVLALDTAGVGAISSSWDVAANNWIHALLCTGTKLYVGGGFTAIAGATRAGLAAVPIDRLFSDGFEDTP